MAKRKWIVIGGLLLVLLVMAVLASGCGTLALLNTIGYQGRLTDNVGNPINGNRNMIFRLYTAQTGGSAIWTETQNNVPVASGLFNVSLGSNTAFDPGSFHQPLYLEVEVGGQKLSRQLLQGAPYAFSLAPGSLIKGYGTTSAFSSTLTIANLGAGASLVVQASNGPAIVTLGDVSAGGKIQSTQVSYWWISGNGLIKERATDTTRWDCDGNGSARIWRGASAGTKNVFYSVTMPAVLFGQPVTLKKITVYYDCQDGSKGYITGTYMYHQTDADSSMAILTDTTDRKSNTATSYTINLTNNNVLSANQGAVSIWVSLSLADDTNYVRIGAIRLELEHQ
jgi:hypothetical protein